MQIKMNNIKSHIPWPTDVQNCIRICAIIVEQSSRCMDNFSHLKHLCFKQSQGVGIGQHKGGNIVTYCCF